MTAIASFHPYLTRWDLIPDGEPIVTATSRLLPVRHRGEPAMLKVITHDEERPGAALLAWYAGDGAVRVHAHGRDAVLMERPQGLRSLAALARSGPEGDADATRTLCAVAARLHATAGRGPLPSSLVPLDVWFRALPPGAARHGDRLPILRIAAAAARDLLASQQDMAPLHGDLHHDNVLDGGLADTRAEVAGVEVAGVEVAGVEVAGVEVAGVEVAGVGGAGVGGAGVGGADGRGWLAIDPKGLLGERGFDYANLFRNPDHPVSPDGAVATRPGRVARTADIVAEVAGLDRTRLLRWVLAFCGLSACWYLEDGVEPIADLTIAALALAELRRHVSTAEPHDPGPTLIESG